MNNLVSSVQGGLPILLVGFGVAGGGFGKIARFFYIIVNFFRVELIAVLVRRVTENNGDGYERNIVFFTSSGEMSIVLSAKNFIIIYSGISVWRGIIR